MSTDIDLYEPGQVIALNHDTSEMMEALTMNLAGSEPSKFMLDQATVPGPGGKRWKLVSADGTESDPEILSGVIVAIEPARSYWKKKFESGGDPPDCASYDGGLTGVALSPNGPGTTCHTCPMNEFGSGLEGRGKACKETRHVLLLTADDPFPILVRIPPTSLRPFNGFLFKEGKRPNAEGRLARPFYTFAVELGIGRTKTATRSDIPCVAPRSLGLLEPREAELARSYSEALKQIFARNAMNPNGTDPAAPASAFTAGETDEQRAERLTAEYGDSIPEE